MAPRMQRKVYTRTGDDGTTGLLYGGRVGKHTVGPGAYGAVDEAVSALGLARAEAERATPPETRGRPGPGAPLTPRGRAAAPEPLIDDVTSRFEPPREFVLPGENRVAAALDVARAVVRRAERESVAASDDGWLP